MAARAPAEAPPILVFRLMGAYSRRQEATPTCIRKKQWSEVVDEYLERLALVDAAFIRRRRRGGGGGGRGVTV
ncbi:hypothetical protein TYRP_002508 [Tyrophagus putrescentiae]|nr:hypothetical protein TYRP_002508 [Tyrophagus putrescentiae]